MRLDNARCAGSGWKAFAFLTLLFALTGVTRAVEYVDWPADYEAKIAAHLEEMKPSGDCCGDSQTFLAFDSVVEVELIALLKDLRNYAKPGFLLLFR